jgi:protein-disulfide isomerase
MDMKAMDNNEEPQATSDVTRRHVLLGAGAVAAVIVAVGGGYYLWTPPEAAVAQPAAGGGEVPMAELMTPGPLGDQVQGAENAPVTIVEYASMTCPHCSHFHETTYPEMKKKYIDTGKVRFIFREFPLDPLAAAAAMLARCAGKDKYFPLIDAFFSQQKDWVVQKPLQPMFNIAKQAGFTQQTFDECLANQQMLNGLEETRTRAAQKFNVNSTPTFFINGKIFRGALTVEELDKQVAPYLKG